MTNLTTAVISANSKGNITFMLHLQAGLVWVTGDQSPSSCDAALHSAPTASSMFMRLQSSCHTHSDLYKPYSRLAECVCVCVCVTIGLCHIGPLQMYDANYCN